MTRYPRLAYRAWPAAVYAIGDIHGCFEQLKDLEARIIEDSAGIEGEKWLVTLGDQIDRGPESAEVIEHVMSAPPPGFRRIALMGNHEEMLLGFLRDPEGFAYYLDEGGAETLESYANGHWSPHIESFDLLPRRHADFIAALPVSLALPGWLFVHAGIRPGLAMDEQTDHDLLWIRAPFLTAQLTGGLRVVHGHTPGEDIVVTPHRICVDTQCFATGKLSAVRVTPDGRTAFFSAQA